LTGKTTDEIQNIQKVAQSDYKFVSSQRELYEKGDDKKAKAYEKLNVRMSNLLGLSNSAGLRDVLANKGTATTDEGRRLVRLTGDRLNEFIAQYEKDGDLDAFEKNVQNAIANTEGVYRDAARMSREFQNAVGLDIDAFTAIGKNVALGNTEATQAEIDRKKDQIDSKLDTRAKNEEVSQQLSKAFATLINLVSGPINWAFQGLLKGVEYLTEALTSSWIGKKLGFASGLADFSMKPLAELTKLQSENAVEIAKKEKELREAPKHSDVTTGNKPDYVNSLHAEKLQSDINDLKYSQQLIALELANKKNASGTAPAPATSSQSSSSSPNAAAQSGTASSSDTTRSTPKFRTGGIFKGPGTGYSVTDTDPMTSNLPKAVIPLPSGQEIPVSFKDLPKDLVNKEQNLLLRSSDIDNILAEYMKTLIGSGFTATETTTPSMTDSINMNDILALVTDKMDSLIYKMNQNIEVQNDLLILARK
jgi:hypothetical protein